MMRAGVIGWPVKHSLSPRLHGYWLRKYGIAGDYVHLEAAPEMLGESLKRWIAEGFIGFNVTVPHKETVMALLDSIDPLAERIGAVNTIVNRNDKLHGTNTDAYGFIHNIRAAYPSFAFNDGSALVLGAGGAARAVVVGLLDQGVPEVLLSNRTGERAVELATELGAANIRVIPWEQRAEKAMLGNAHLLVNTTTLGMTGQAPLDMSLDHLPKSALVTDIVYKPLYTDLLVQAQKRGNPVLDGLGMLLHQAVPGFELWFGKRPEVTQELREYVLEGMS